MSLIVVTIGLGLFLRNLYLMLFEGRPRPYDDFTIQTNFDLGPISLRPKDFWVMAICVIVLLGVALMLQKTRSACRCAPWPTAKTSPRHRASTCDRVILATWIAVPARWRRSAACCIGISRHRHWDMGFTLLLLMFAAVVLGGLGTAYGPMVGGDRHRGRVAGVDVLDLDRSTASRSRSPSSSSSVLIRPQGILGRTERVG